MAGRRKHGFETTGLPFADLLAAEMEARSLNLPKTAELIRRAAAGGSERSRASMSLVCKWRAGTITPGPNHARLVARALDLPVEAVAAAVAAQRRQLGLPRLALPEATPHDRSLGAGERASTATAPVLDSAEEEVERQEFIKLAVVGLAGALVPGLDSLLHLPIEVGPGRIGAEEISGLEETARFLARAEAKGGGARWHGAVVGQLRAVSDAVDGRFPPELHTRLLDVTADLAQLAGWTSYDSGRFVAADRHYRYALQICQRADNWVLEAKVLGDLAQLANALGHHRDELRYLTRATSLLPPYAPGAVRGELLGLRARALAHLNQVQEAERTIGDCLASLPDSGDDSLPNWAGYLSPGELSCLAANLYIQLATQQDPGPARRDHAAEAERQAQHALSSRGGASQRTRVLDMLRLAQVRLLQHDPAEAASVATDALTTAAGIGSFLVVNRLASFYKLLAQTDTAHPAVSEFGAAFRGYLAGHTTWAPNA